MTTLPALSTPCTWNTFLARSTPMVLTCIWTTPSGDSLLTITLGTSDAGSGRRPPHHFRPTLRVSAAVRCLLFPESDLLTGWQRNDANGMDRPRSRPQRLSECVGG